MNFITINLRGDVYRLDLISEFDDKDSIRIYFSFSEIYKTTQNRRDSIYRNAKIICEDLAKEKIEEYVFRNGSLILIQSDEELAVLKQLTGEFGERLSILKRQILDEKMQPKIITTAAGYARIYFEQQVGFQSELTTPEEVTSNETEVDPTQNSLFGAGSVSDFEIFNKTQLENLPRELKQKILFKENTRHLKPATAEIIEKLNTLENEMPNLAEVIIRIKKMISVSIVAGTSVKLFPTLLVGEPGIGKTFFAEKIAECLGVESSVLDMASTSAGFVLSGSDSSWHESKPGRIFETLMSSENANPVVVLDEIDKISAGRYDPIGPLYRLLEKNSASKFNDEHFGGKLTLDASHIIWFATANSVESLSEAILSRFEVINVPTPNPQEKAKIAHFAYKNLLAEMGWSKIFNADLDNDVAISMDKVTSIREMRKMLSDGCGNAIAAGRSQLHLDDMHFKQSRKRVGAGFF